MLVAFNTTEQASTQKNSATYTQVLQHLQLDSVKIIFIFKSIISWIWIQYIEKKLSLSDKCICMRKM